VTRVRRTLAAISAVAATLGAALALAAPAQAVPNCDVPVPPPACVDGSTASPLVSLDGAQQTVTKDGIHVWGWAADADAPTNALTVKFTVDGGASASVVANVSRPDVAAAFPVFGARHGWDLVLPASAAGHSVCATAISVGGGANASACKQMDAIVGFQANAITYDTAHGVLSGATLAQLDRVTNTNNTDVQQSTQISGTKTVTDMEGWSQTSTVNVSLATSLHFSVPAVVDGTITLTVGLSSSYTSNGSTTTANTFTWQQPVLVPAHSTVVATVTVTHATVTVPYTMTGNLQYQSGALAPGALNGTFTGSESYDLQVAMTQTNADGTAATAPVRQPAATVLKSTR
jgi:hypothetical protein